jgi:hypothetical protein
MKTFAVSRRNQMLLFFSNSLLTVMPQPMAFPAASAPILGGREQIVNKAFLGVGTVNSKFEKRLPKGIWP